MTPGGTFDVVVVGAGINGLVAAAELARTGRRVCLLEAADTLGGFIASGELTAPGYVHDTYSSWHPLLVTGGAFAELGADLARHGLVHANTEDALCASVADDGRVTLAQRDPARTAEAFADPADRTAYLGMLDHLGADLPSIGALLGAELRAAAALRPVAAMARRGGRAGLERWARDTAASGRAFLRREFTGPEVDHLWAPWLLHAGLAPDNASGGLMVPLFAGTMHAAGLPVVVGGADGLVRAFAGVLAEHEAVIRTGAAVEEVVVESGRAVAVRVGGERIDAAEAVVASVSPAALYQRLLPPAAVRPEVLEESCRYRPGRAAMQVHLALRAPLAWRDERLTGTPLVHLSDGSSSTAIACAEAEAGLLPRRPTVVVGQQHVLDPSRAPAGAATLWVQLQEVPHRPTGDAAGELDTTGGWTGALTAGYLDRVLDRIEAHAPGLRERVVGTAVLTPPDLEAANRNAEAGDPYGGSAELDQNLLWRPGPASSRHRTTVPGLWHVGAATHPGPGLGGGSGHLVAQAIITRGRRRQLRPFPTPWRTS